jgi:hypothetical protein
VLRSISILSTDGAPTALGYPDQRRFDLLGQLARHGLTEPPIWLQAGLPLLALAAILIVIRVTRNPLLVSAVACTSILIGFYHGTYDSLLLIIPVAVGIGMAVRGQLTGWPERIAVAAPLLVVLHLHTVTTTLIPGFDVRAADTVDMILIVTGLVGLSVGASEETGSQGTGIREVAFAHFDDGDVWAAKTNRIADDGSFYIYAADTARMLDLPDQRAQRDLRARCGAARAAPCGHRVAGAVCRTAR